MLISEALREALAKINTAGKQLLKFASGLLDMTRVESGRLDFNDEEASIKSCVFAWKKLLDGVLTEKNLTFEVDLSGVINDEVFMDKDKCSRSMMGVLNNAVQYTPAGGRIKLSAVQGEINSVGRFRYTFTVEDNGIGISKDFLPSIF